MSEISHGFSKRTQEILQEKLTTHSRKGPGGTYQYYKGEDVIRALNKAFGHCWSSEVIHTEEIHGQILVQASVWVFADGDTVVHHGFGSAPIPVNKNTNKVIDVGNAYKSAYTGAIKKAAEQFGIGLGTSASSSKSSGSYNKGNPATAPHKSFSKPPEEAPPRSGDSRPPLKPAGGLKPRYNNALAPSAPASEAPAPQAAPSNQPSSGAATFSPGDAELSEKITDVQKGAIERLTKRKNIAVDKAIEGALKDSNKSLDDLTKAEAALVVRYSHTVKAGV